MPRQKIKRLNWGCGNTRPSGWINSDQQRLTGLKYVADIRKGLPFASDYFHYVVSVHALQELPYHDLVPALQELRRVLRPGGTLRLVLPDLLKGVDAFRAGQRDYFAVTDHEVERLGSKLAVQLVWFGHNRSLFTSDYIEELLLKAGFSTVAHCAFNQTESPWPEIVELDNRERESIFVEATK
jgi:predicted SAM-dependent methyltransferase